MAFTLPSATLAENYHIISIFDPAVDREVDDEGNPTEDFRDRWNRYRDGLEDPPLKAGATPTIFEMAHLSRRHSLSLEVEAEKRGGYDGWFLACAYALRGAKNLEDETGKTIKFERELDVHELSRVKLEILDRLPTEVVIELGNIALERLRSASSPLS